MTEQKKSKGKRGLRPHTWCTGPDKRKHDMFRAWHTSRAQANYRKEIWNLTLDEFCAAWDPYWENRGRGRDSYCMTRYDIDGPWDKDNIVMVTRLQHLRRKVYIGDTNGTSNQIHSQGNNSQD